MFHKAAAKREIEKKSKASGFSIVELVVVITIMIVMTSIVIFNKRDFNDSMILTNLAYDIALSIREAQVYGIAVRASEGQFDKAYGVNLSQTDPAEITTANHYVIFVDGSTNFPRDFMYQAGEILLREYRLNRGYFFSACVHLKSEPDPNIYASCSSESTSPSNMGVSFYRPDPDAYFSFSEGGSVVYDEKKIDKILIAVFSPSGVGREIVVYRNGQISVCGVEGC